MSDRTNGVPKRGFARLVPELDVLDFVRSRWFWCDVLGFGVAYQRLESGFAFLERQGAQIMLCQCNGNWETAPLERPLGRGINFQIFVESIEPILTSLAAVDWPLFAPPHEAWYRIGTEEVGLRQFLVQDPDGYLVRFAEDLGRRPAPSH